MIFRVECFCPTTNWIVDDEFKTASKAIDRAMTVKAIKVRVILVDEKSKQEREVYRRESHDDSI